MKFTIFFSIFFFSLFNHAYSQWKELLIRDAMGLYLASSELNEVSPFEGLGKYGAHKLFDKDPATAWVEGVEGFGKGESVFLGIGSVPGENLFITNGYQKSEKLYYMNNRPKTIKLSLYVGYMIPGDLTQIGSRWRALKFDKTKEISLPDTTRTQKIRLPFNAEEASDFAEKNL